MPAEKPFYWEVHLTHGLWASIPSELATWYEYNYSHQNAEDIPSRGGREWTGQLHQEHPLQRALR